MNQDKNDVLLAERVAARGLSAVQNKDESGALQAVLGLIKGTAGNYSESADWYLAAALMAPSNIQYWLQASTMLSPNRDLKFAENVLLQGLESHPNSPQLLYHMGTGMIHSRTVYTLSLTTSSNTPCNPRTHTHHLNCCITWVQVLLTLVPYKPHKHILYIASCTAHHRTVYTLSPTTSSNRPCYASPLTHHLNYGMIWTQSCIIRIV